MWQYRIEATRQILASQPGIRIVPLTGHDKKDFVRLMLEAGASAIILLTDRERQVLQLLSEGYSTKEMAGRLGISIKTIETHRRNMMEKLDLHSVAEPTKYAITEGITSLDE